MGVPANTCDHTEGKCEFKNKFLSLVWENGRLNVFDSDGKYFDYVFSEDMRESKKDEEQTIRDTISDVRGRNEEETLEWIEHFWCVLKVFPGVGTSTGLHCLYRRYGEDYVCRFGTTAVLIRE